MPNLMQVTASTKNKTWLQGDFLNISPFVRARVSFLYSALRRQGMRAFSRVRGGFSPGRQIWASDIFFALNYQMQNWTGYKIGFLNYIGRIVCGCDGQLKIGDITKSILTVTQKFFQVSQSISSPNKPLYYFFQNLMIAIKRVTVSNLKSTSEVVSPESYF